jgi:hypothetical protein
MYRQRRDEGAQHDLYAASLRALALRNSVPVQEGKLTVSHQVALAIEIAN